MTAQQIVRQAYPDAICVMNAMRDRYMIISDDWWPGTLGYSYYRGIAWSQAAATVQRQQKRILTENS